MKMHRAFGMEEHGIHIRILALSFWVSCIFKKIRITINMLKPKMLNTLSNLFESILTFLPIV